MEEVVEEEGKEGAKRRSGGVEGYGKLLPNPDSESPAGGKGSSPPSKGRSASKASKNELDWGCRWSGFIAPGAY